MSGWLPGGPSTRISVSLGQLEVPLARRALPGLHIPVMLCVGLFTAQGPGEHTHLRLCLTGDSTRVANSLEERGRVSLFPVALVGEGLSLDPGARGQLLWGRHPFCQKVETAASSLALSADLRSLFLGQHPCLPCTHCPLPS